MSSPSGPRICMSATTSNFSAAVTSASAACCGVLNILGPTGELVAGVTAFAVTFTVVFAADCGAARPRDADRHAKANAPRVQTRPGKLLFADVDFIVELL